MCFQRRDAENAERSAEKTKRERRQVVGQPILAAAGFQPAFAGRNSPRMARRSRLERRLQAEMPAPQRAQPGLI